MKAQTIDYLMGADLCGMTREKCAEHFGIHPQTLQAKLQAEDVDFRFLLQMVREDRVKGAETLKEASRLTGLSIDRACKLRKRVA